MSHEPTRQGLEPAPNLLFVIADQFRAMCVEPGGDPVATPHLESMMAHGVSLTHAVSSYPVCSPHRAMMISGQYPEANGVTMNVHSESAANGVGLRPDTTSWAAVLRDAGYNTGYIGKWHLEAPVPDDAIYGRGPLEDGRYWDAWSPPERRHGFDFWYSYGCCDEHLTPHYWTSDAGRHQRTNVTGWSAAHETDMAIDFLNRAAASDQPFALAVSWNPPHQPFDQLPDDYDPRYGELPAATLLNRPNVDLTTPTGQEAAAIAPLYYAAVNAIDTQMGRLLAHLASLGLTENTLVIFTSDHGQQMGSHELLYKNVPYEESMRIPWIMHWPGQLNPDAATTVGLSSIDIAPTLLGLLGQGGSIPAEMVGTNLAPALLSTPTPGEGMQETLGTPSSLYFFYGRDDDAEDIRGLRTATHKIVARYSPAGGFATELYDLRDDPYELCNISDPGLVKHWTGELAAALAKAGQTWRGTAELERAA